MRTDLKIGVAVGLCFVIAFIFYYVIGGSDSEPSEPQDQETQIVHNDDDTDTGDESSPFGADSGTDSGWTGFGEEPEPPSPDLGADDEGSDIFPPDEPGDTGSEVASTAGDPDDTVRPRLGGPPPEDDTDSAYRRPFDTDDTAPAPSSDDEGTDVAGTDREESTFDTGSYRDPWARREEDDTPSPLSRDPEPADTSRGPSGVDDGGLPTNEYTWHEVRENETLSSIARAFYGEARYYQAILEANPDVEEYNLRPGKRLRMPPVSQVVNRSTGSSGSTGAAGSDLSLPAGWKAHKIASGDLLGTISQKYYGSTKYWQAIQSANPDINPRALPVGKVLKIPPPEEVIKPSATGSSGSTGSTARRGSSQPPIQVPAGWKVHVVQEGDMLSTISQQYYGSSRYWGLLQDNNPDINPNNMQVGQQVRIPPKPAGASAPVPVPSGTARSSDAPRSTDLDEYQAPMPDFGG